MITNYTGAIVDGTLQLDQRVELPDSSRVQVTITPCSSFPDWQQRWQLSLANMEQLKATRPISSGGKRFTREQLHERR